MWQIDQNHFLCNFRYYRNNIELRHKQKSKSFNGQMTSGHAPLPLSKSKFNLYEASIKSDRVNLVAPPSPVHTAKYSTNWERKG